MRAYIVSRVRGNAPNIFAVDVKPGVYTKAYDRSEVPAIVTLLRNPKLPDEPYPRYCAVLYKDGFIAGSNVFGGTAIVNVSQSLVADVTSNYFHRFSKPSFSVNRHSPGLLAQAAQVLTPLLPVQGSSQSLLG